MESLVSDIPAGDGKTANLFLQCVLSVPPDGDYVYLVWAPGREQER